MPGSPKGGKKSPGGKKGKSGKKGKGKDKKKHHHHRHHGRTEAELRAAKEHSLHEELEELDTELDDLKIRVNEQRLANDWLRQEYEKVNTESEEYMSYMEDKTNKRQSTIVAMNDQNQREIQDIREEKKKLIAETSERKANLKQLILEKENALNKCQREIDKLDEYKNLQNNQFETISELEQEVMAMKLKHTDAIQDLKVHFLGEKKQYAHQTGTKSAMAKRVSTEAVQCLEDFTENIKKENRKLKKQLLQLIQQTRALNLHRQQLTEQKRQLLQEQEYAKDLKNIRAKQYKLNKSNWRTPSADNINPVQSDTSATRMQEKDSSQKLKYM